jgi:hypothetical protein
MRGWPGSNQWKYHGRGVCPQILEGREQVEPSIVAACREGIAQSGRRVRQIVHEGVFQCEQFAQLSAESFPAIGVARQGMFSVVGPLQQSQAFDKDADHKRIGAVGSVTPQSSGSFP